MSNNFVKIITKDNTFFEEKNILQKSKYFENFSNIADMRNIQLDPKHIKLAIDILKNPNKPIKNPTKHLYKTLKYFDVPFIEDECAIDVENDDSLINCTINLENPSAAILELILNEFYYEKYNKPKFDPFKKPILNKNYSLEYDNIYSGKDLSFGEEYAFIISKVGDLMYDIHFELDIDKLSKGYRWINFLGYKIFEFIELSIDNMCIRIPEDYLYIHNELYVHPSNRSNDHIFFYSSVQDRIKMSQKKQKIIIQFPFFKIFQDYIPLIGFYEHHFRIKIRPINELIIKNNLGKIKKLKIKINSLNVTARKIFLDNDHRKNIATINSWFINKIAYFTKKINFIKHKKTTKTEICIDINKLYLVKDIVIVVHKNYDIKKKNYFAFGCGKKDILVSASMFINGHARFNLGNYYLGTKIPQQTNGFIPVKGIYQYAFCVNDVLNSVPSGFIDFMKVDNVKLVIETLNVKGKIDLYFNMSINIKN